MQQVQSWEGKTMVKGMKRKSRQGNCGCRGWSRGCQYVWAKDTYSIRRLLEVGFQIRLGGICNSTEDA